MTEKAESNLSCGLPAVSLSLHTLNTKIRHPAAFSTAASTFYQLSSSLEPTKQSLPERRLVSATLLSLAETTWSQISKRDGLISKRQISSSGQANANSCSSVQGGEDVIKKPAFLPSYLLMVFPLCIRMVNSCLCSHESKRRPFHTAAVTNLIPGPQMNNLD